MSSGTEPWFVSERSEAIAGLLLSSREDIQIRDERKRDGEVDFLVELRGPEPIATHLFVVKVKGSMSSTPAELSRAVEPVLGGIGREVSMPVCIIVANVRDNRMFYTWAVEPTIEGPRATLAVRETASLIPLDPKALDELIARVRTWYRVLATQLIPA